MASKLFLSRLQQNAPIQIRKAHEVSVKFPDKIGNRDVVGHGYNGSESYIDRVDFILPAIRFKANTPDIMALREKEKGDWKKLSIDEKKALYRASFRQTLTEIQAPTGAWKGHIGCALLGVSFTLVLYMIIKIFALPGLPKTFDEEHRLAQLERMNILEMNPITGMQAKRHD